MLKSLTIVLGAILASMLMFQIAANTASEMVYWETYDPASSRLLWCGVIAVGLLLGGTVMMLQKPRFAAMVFAVSLPLMFLYEAEYNRNYLSTPMDESVAYWIGFGIVALAVLAWFSGELEKEPS